MITKWIEFTVAAESAETFAAEFAKMQEASRPEKGCAHYSVFGDKADRNVFTVLESWETAENLKAHRESAHMAAFKEKCGAMIVEKRALDLQAIDLG
jgi:quinol monooxygenase YgiN